MILAFGIRARFAGLSQASKEKQRRRPNFEGRHWVDLTVCIHFSLAKDEREINAHFNRK